MKHVKNIQIILMTIFGMVGSILTGVIFYNSSVFSIHNMTFQFVTAGISGSLLFSFFEYKKKKEQIFLMLLLLIFHIVLFTGKRFSETFLIRDVIYLAGLFFSIKFYHQFLKRNPNLKYYIRCLALVLFYGLINTIAVSLIYIINSSFVFPPLDFIIIIAKLGILLGLGIGIGIDFYLQNEERLCSLLKLKVPDNN